MFRSNWFHPSEPEMRQSIDRSSTDCGNPSTPSRSTRTERPLPPWPVSPATPHSPTKTDYSPICPGAPVKNRYSQDGDTLHEGGDDEQRFHERMRQRGIVPRKLNFGNDDSRGASTTNIPNHPENYPILDISTPPRSAPPPCPSSSQLDNDDDNQDHSTTTPVLEMRPRRQGNDHCEDRFSSTKRTTLQSKSS